MNIKYLFNHKRIRILGLVLCHVVYLISGIFNQAIAQEEASTLADILVRNGYENVEIVEKSDTISIFFENRRYRFEPQGLANVLIFVADKIINQDAIVRFVLLKNKAPMLKLELDLKSYKMYLSGGLSSDELYKAMEASLDVSDIKTGSGIVSNSSAFKTDVVVIPVWAAKFGNFDNPVESNINLIPELYTTLSKGLTLKAQLIIPIQNDFFFIAERETIRPGSVTLNQFVSLPDNFYLNITGGCFDKNRAGLNIDVKKAFREGQFEIGTNVGFTSYYSFTGIETEFYDKQKYLTVILNSQYRYKPYDLLVRLDIGNFLFNVPAVQFEVMRQFGEVEIGFFAIATKDDYDGGFRFSIPIPPQKYTKMNWFRIRPAEAFSWKYRAKGFPQNGVTYNTGYSLTSDLMEYNPDFIKKRLIIEINKLKK